MQPDEYGESKRERWQPEPLGPEPQPESFMFEDIQIVACNRCSVPCRVNPDRGPDARLLRHADEGLCANCAITVFLKKTVPLDAIIEEQGPQVLLEAAIQAQVGRVLAAANSDASPDEINWSTVIALWDLPLPKGARGYGG